MPPGQHIVQASSEAWPEAGAQAERSLNTGWVLDQTLTSTGGFTTNARSNNSTSFFSTGDGTSGSGNSYYALYRKLRVVQGTTSIYCRVLSASYSTATTETAVGVGDFQGATTALSSAAMTTVALAALYIGSSGYGPGNEAGLRATGDMLYRDSTGITRLAVGASSQAIFGGTVPQWAVPPTNPVLSYAELTSNFTTTSTTMVNITGLSVSASAASTANNVEVSMALPQQYVSSTDATFVYEIFDNTAASVLLRPALSRFTVSQQSPIYISRIIQFPSTATRTLVGRASISVGTLSIDGSTQVTNTIFAREYR